MLLHDQGPGFFSEGPRWLGLPRAPMQVKTALLTSTHYETHYCRCALPTWNPHSIVLYRTSYHDSAIA